MKNLLDLRARGLAPALLVLLSLSFTLALRAQEKAPIGDEVFVVVEEQPRLIPDNETGIQQMQASIRYPEIAKRAGVEGRVIVQFVVDETGTVVNPQIIRGIGAGCDEEALRAVRELRFTPGKQRGQTVKVQMTLPVTFKLAEQQAQVNMPGDAPSVHYSTAPDGAYLIESRNMTASEFADKMRERIRELEGLPGQEAFLVAHKEALRQAEAGVTSARVTPQFNANDEAPSALQLLDVQRSEGSISGRVLDRSTGLPLAGANVVVEGARIGSATDREGRFVLRGLPATGADQIRVSFVGFEPLVASVAQGEGAALPEGYRLDGVPNPTGGQTEILFSVPSAGHARVEVYNAIGRQVAVLLDETVTADQPHRITFNSSAYESGVYFVRLTHDGHQMTRAVTVAR